MVDELATFREYLLQHHPDIKVTDLSRPTLWERVQKVMSKFVSVSSDPAVLNFAMKDYSKSN